MNKKWIAALFVAVAFAACGEPTEPLDVKPAADPDEGLVSTSERADALSNRYTTIVGGVELGQRVEGKIDYPEWFHGYTIELEEGDEVRFRLTSGARSIVRLYGPAKYVTWDGRPLFARHEVSETMRPSGGSWATDFVYEPLESGLYMVVTGPLDVWSAKYDIELTCVGGLCNTKPGECFSNDECAADEVCADNGVRCITAPCDANYDVCQPAPASECQTNDDCTDGYCRFANADRTHMECVPYYGEGESCQGFVLPHTVQICDPSLSCVTRPYIADAPGVCRNVTTVRELVNNPSTYEGVRVSIDGDLGHGLAYCTKMACPADDPCCNRCGAGQVLRDYDSAPDEVDLRRADGSSFGCNGDECNIAETCDLREGPTRVLGTLKQGQFGDLYFEVETVTWLGGLN